MLELSIFNYINKNEIKLESLIKNYSKLNPLGIDEFCPKCQKNSPSFYQTVILNAPNILIIFIIRVFNGQYYENTIDFPSMLNLRDCILEDKNKSANFELIGIINHTGSAQFGHYTADCKNFIDKNWYHFNDSWADYLEKDNSAHKQSFNIKNFWKSSDNEIEEGRNISDKALLLFYQREGIHEQFKWI